MNRTSYATRVRRALVLFALAVALASHALRATGPHSDRVLVLAGIAAGLIFAPIITAVLYPRTRQ